MKKDPVFAGLAAAFALACSSPSSPTASETTTGATITTNGQAPAMYQRFQSAVTIAVEGTSVVLRSNSTPDHNSPYWSAGNAMYEAPHAGMQVNPNRIVAQTLTLRVPINPTLAVAPSDTPLGPMGMAVNGVPLFNQYAAGRSPLTNEILSFDRYNGHPQQTGQYHYHLEPLWLTGLSGPSSLVGVMLDGFPVYGPRETSGSAPSGLDSCNGHIHATADAPGGIYHYHTTIAVPYISGCYKGTSGSIG